MNIIGQMDLPCHQQSTDLLLSDKAPEMSHSKWLSVSTRTGSYFLQKKRREASCMKLCAFSTIVHVLLSWTCPVSQTLWWSPCAEMCMHFMWEEPNKYDTCGYQIYLCIICVFVFSSLTYNFSTSYFSTYSTRHYFGSGTPFWLPLYKLKLFLKSNWLCV